MDTPIYDDIVEAYACGIREYHVHWRLEISWAEADEDFPF
jgi:hypothetical protein